MHMKNLLLKTLVLAGLWGSSQCVMADGDDFESAKEAVKNMKVGWNLGNTLDSNSGDTLNMWIEKWSSRKTSDYETAWGQPVTKPQLLKMFKEAGFNAIRVPVTWWPHMEAKFQLDGTAWSPSKDDLGTKIQSAWMKRVHDVVDYVIDAGMYCILNVHHDTGDGNTCWIRAGEDAYTKNQAQYEAIWKQIAEEFKDYGEQLVFEGYNEMLDTYGSWCFASFQAPGNYNAAVAKSAYNGINSYAQSFVNTVRSTGGNNMNRNLVVSTYGACCGDGSWSSHLNEPLTQMKLPEDVVDGHLIFEVHSYPYFETLSSGQSSVRSIITKLKSNLVSKGAPVIIGEWGSGGGISYSNQKEDYLKWAQYFVEQAKANDICTFYWMGLSDGTARSTPRFNEEDLKDAIIKGYYGEEGYTAISTTKTENPKMDVFSLSGTKLYSGTTLEEVKPKLQRGVYIVGGKKILIQ